MNKAQTLDVRVYYEDTDAGGVVYYANYLKYFERGRTEFLRQLGFEQHDLMKQNIVFAVRNANIDYLKSARLDNLIQVITEIEKLKKVSIVFKQTIKLDDEILCSAQVTVVCVNTIEFKPAPIPQKIMSQLSHE